jgi:hypothetical protein
MTRQDAASIQIHQLMETRLPTLPPSGELSSALRCLLPVCASRHEGWWGPVLTPLHPFDLQLSAMAMHSTGQLPNCVRF